MDEGEGPEDRCGAESPIEGRAVDLGIMAQLDEMLTPHQPRMSIEYRAMMKKEQFPFLDGPVASERVELSPEEANDIIRERAFTLEASLVGFTELDPRYVVRGRPVAGRWAVSIAYAMDYDEIVTAPEASSGIEVTRAYYDLGRIIVELAAYIRSLGYKARAHHPRNMDDSIGQVLHKPIAWKAGLGEIGRNTLVITPEFGPRVRLATISTELEVVPGRPMSIGISEFCDKCRKCLRNCPTGAIPDQKIEVHPPDGPHEGRSMVWRIDYRKCLPLFIRTDGCAVCVKECTFNQRPEHAIRFVKRTLGKDVEQGR